MVETESSIPSREETGQCMQRCQPSIAGGDAVAPLGLKKGQEVSDLLGGEVGEVEIFDRLLGGRSACAKKKRAAQCPSLRQLIEMLKRPEGATIDDIVKKFDWQAHTVRGALAGALKKRLGLKVQSARVEGRGRIYRIKS
jgi:hypothetical protein